MIRKLMHLVKDEQGVTALEYGLIAALIAAAIVGGVTLLGTTANTTFTNAANDMSGAGS